MKKTIVIGASVATLVAAGYVLAAGSFGVDGSTQFVSLSAAGVSSGNDAPSVAATPATTGRLIAAARGRAIPDSYICVFKKAEVTPSGVYGAAAEATRRGGGQLRHVYGKALRGFSVTIPAQAAQMLIERNPNIDWCEQDQGVFIIDGVTVTAKAKVKTTQPVQTTPPGILAVRGGAYTGGNRAWVIDTGIDLTHPDLNVEPSYPVGLSRNFVSGETSPQDQNGHGTHVSGTIAAIDNRIGVVGVAAGARVIAVRVLDKNGSGSTSDVIAGVDYVAANGRAGDVANMSLGGTVSAALDAAVINGSSVVKFALAAGNNAGDANNYSPARVNGPNIYTVAALTWDATTSTGTWASFSNYNTAIVDYIEPGVNILSTWIGGGYNTISGTSMATPHAAGILLWGTPTTKGTVTRPGTSEVYTFGTR